MAELQGYWYYFIVLFWTIGLKLHWISPFNENVLILPKNHIIQVGIRVNSYKKILQNSVLFQGDLLQKAL